MTRLTRFCRQAKAVATRLHRDQRGAEGMEKLLIVAAIVLPLLALLLIFRDELTDWVREKWDEVKSDAGG